MIVFFIAVSFVLLYGKMSVCHSSGSDPEMSESDPENSESDPEMSEEEDEDDHQDEAKLRLKYGIQGFNAK